MFDISPIQVLLALGVALLVFGPRRLPEIGRGIGRGLRDFRSGLSGAEPEAPAPPARADVRDRGEPAPPA